DTSEGPIGGKNEMERSYYIDAVLRDIVKLCGEDVQINQQYNIVGSRVDFVIKHTNLRNRKRKLEDLDGYDYVYGIVFTGDQWIFTV
ncbi:524_t:CDS:2, partial [Paraglomus brasilianum]